MRGIILAAGKGTRLYPLTKPVSKPLLPIYDKPLIYYPMTALMGARIREILVIIPPGDESAFVNTLGDGSQWGISIQYKEQMVPRGIADAFLVGEEFIGDDDVCLALGDNIFYGPFFRAKTNGARQKVEEDGGAVIFGYYVTDPRAFGVVEFDEDGKALSIEEKPTFPKSHYIVPGLYFYDNEIVEKARNLQPSARGELEITDLNSEYLEEDKLWVSQLGREYTWFDAGNADSLYEASGSIKNAQRSGRMIGCPEYVALRNKWITPDQVKEIASGMATTSYGRYLRALAAGLD